MIGSGKNSWQLQIYTGVVENGKHQRKYVTVRGTKREAQKKLNELLVNLEKGISVPVSRLTVADHLRNWLEGYVKTNCSQRTYDGYESIITHRLIPNLGHIRLKNLRKHDIEAYYGKAREKLSPRTVHHYHRVLSEALKQAEIDGHIGSNPCKHIIVKAPRAQVMRTLTQFEVEALLDIAKDNYYYPVIYTAISTGLRQAELLGLRWRDIDLDMLSISVSQVLYKRQGVYQFKEPKTAHSRRHIAMTPKLASYLREYRLDREMIYKQLGVDLTLDSLVFGSPEGKPLNPSVLTHNFSRIAKQAGLGNVHCHDLRHTFASLMLLRGAKPKVISEALGHSSVAFTMDTYSHIIEGMQEDAMALLDEVLPVGINGKNNAKLTLNSVLE